MEVLRTFNILKRLERKFPKDDILAGKKDGVWQPLSIHQEQRENRKV